jgi:tetratricopeptide (TPR) repeat protein
LTFDVCTLSIRAGGPEPSSGDSLANSDRTIAAPADVLEALRPAPLRGYRALFAAGLFLYGLCAVVGLGYAGYTRSLPGLAITPYQQAERDLERGEIARAVRQLRMSARIDRTDYESARQVAFVLQAAGDRSGQIDQHERGRDLHPGDANAHRRLAWAYYGNLRFDDADASFVRALRLDPRDADAYLGRAGVGLNRHRAAEAEGFARKALDLQSSNANAWTLLGVALRAQGQGAQAADAFRRAAALEAPLASPRSARLPPGAPPAGEQ